MVVRNLIIMVCLYSDMIQDNDHDSEVSDGEHEENGMLCHVKFKK